VCQQRRVINRRKAEERLLEGIKAALLAPAAIKEMARRVRSRLRQVKQPDKAALKADLQRLDTQIDNIVDTLATVGKSVALAARLQQLETSKAAIVSQIAHEPEPIQVIPNVEKLIRERVRALEQIPRDAMADPALIEKARAAVHGLLGHVVVVEDGDDVVAEVDLGRWYINHGAEDWLPILYTKRFVLS
jgi:hypothetical protein